MYKFRTDQNNSEQLKTVMDTIWIPVIAIII